MDAVSFGRHLLLLLLVVVPAVFANMRAPSFGKMRWGQDQNNLYITAFIPGVSVTDDLQEFTINNTHFDFVATNPVNSEVYRLSFEFREEVNSSAVVQRHHMWKYGNSNNSLFALIPKLEPHLFDRLHYQKPDKKLKFAIEKDWDRYTVSDDMMDEEDEDAEAKTVKDGLRVLTDSNYVEQTADKKLSVYRVHYPWCSECKSHDHLTKAAKSKKGKRLAKKYGILFGVVDAREERQLRRDHSAVCKPEGESQECMDFMYTKYPGEEPNKWSSGGTKNQSELLSKVLKIAGSSPHMLTAVHEIEQMQKDSGDEFMAVGFFDRSKHPQEAAAFEHVASSTRREEMMFAMVEESQMALWKRDYTVDDLAAKLLKTDCDAKPLQAPAIVVLKNWLKSPEDRSFAVFGQFTPTVRQFDEGQTGEADQTKADEFTNDSVDEFIADNLGTNVAVLKTTDQKFSKNLEDRAGERTRIRLFVSDAKKADAQIKVLKCAAQELHREATFFIHDEKAELGTGSLAKNANKSDATLAALLDYGIGGEPGPLLVMDQLEIDKSQSKYVLRMENSANYIVKQIRKAVAGNLPKAVRSEPAPLEAPRQGQVGTVVGSTLGSTLSGADALLMLFHQNPGNSKLAEVEASKVTQALMEVGSNILVLAMDRDKNHCNASDAAIPGNLDCAASAVHFISRNQNAVKYTASNVRANPVLQFIHDNTDQKFDVVKAQEHVKFLDNQCTVTLHQHDRRGGQGAVLRVGRFDLSALVEAGLKNDDVSSVTVSDGCEVTLFENGDFSGWNATFEPGRYNVNEMEKRGFKNDEASSVVVEVYVPPKPPVQTEAPLAVKDPSGNVNLSWTPTEQEDTASKANRFQVHAKRADNPNAATTSLGSVTVKVQKSDEAPTQMEFVVLKTQPRLEKGTEYTFELQPFSTKAGAGSRSPPSNAIPWGDIAPVEPADETKPADETNVAKDEF